MLPSRVVLHCGRARCHLARCGRERAQRWGAVGARPRPAKGTVRMTKTSPLVSIVVPAFNAERFLSEALTSVCAQTHDAIEVIVCDDASTDRTLEIAGATGDPRVRNLRNDQTLGGYGAMNRAVRDSRGEFVAIYHADDVYDPRIV